MFSQPIVERDSWVELLVKALAWIAFVIGIVFRFWATLYVGGRKRVELLRDGPYSLCRNPLYLGSLFVALATGLFLESASFAMFLLVVMVVYVFLTVPAEESDLRAIHGAAYDDYCRNVPRFWPRPSLFHTSPVIDVWVRGLRRESKRAVLWLLVPVLGSLVCYLRYRPEWPHLFRLL
jgi:protein-S-isoprenylcysteine O-methyltransferase Ste14